MKYLMLLLVVTVTASTVVSAALVPSHGSGPQGKGQRQGQESQRLGAKFPRPSAPTTAFGRLVRVERSNKASVRIISGKVARNEIRSAKDGRTFLILHFSGKTKLDLGAGSEQLLKVFVSKLGAGMVRTTDQSWLADGSGEKYSTAYVVSNPLTRTLAFDVPVGITGLTWNDGTNTFKLEPSPVLVTGAAENKALNKNVSTNIDTAKTNVRGVHILTAQEAFDALKQLNDERKLFPLSLFGASGSGSGLKAENCFGLTLRPGGRLVGESNGTNYGFEMSSTDRPSPSVMIGFLYSEIGFEVEGKLFHQGPHLVLAGPEHVRIIGDGEGFTTMGTPSGSKDVPKMESQIFPARSPIDPALVGKDSKARIKFSLTHDKGGVFINVGGNRLAIRGR